MANGLDLGQAYSATLSRIKGQGGERSRLGMATLMWLSHSERPLKADELCRALAVEIGSPNFNIDNVPSIGTLLACCQGLVAVDKEASTVRLIHFTLQEYLLAHPELFGSAHSKMAETCLSYLNSQQVNALSASPYPDLRGTPFLEYCSLYWGMHAKRDLSYRAKLLALKLFDNLNNYISTKILIKARRPFWFFFNRQEPFLFSGLHCASAFGIVEIVASLLEVESCNINQTDCTGGTPLIWAAWSGHERVVEILLARDDASPNQPDKYGQTPLYCAAENGHEGVVEMLLGRSGVNPDQPDEDGNTPLCCAAENGHRGVVEILLGRDDVDPNKRGMHGQTPLYCAAGNGHEGVVEILLGRDDIDPNKPDEYGQTPLCYAAESGHEQVVEILLGWGGVNPNQPDEDGNTPLCCAAKNGHEGVVEILLGWDDVNPNQPGGCGQTPLCYAALNGHEEVVEILLGRDDVDPHKPDMDGRPPLWWAAKYCHARVVALLRSWESAAPSAAKRRRIMVHHIVPE